MSLSNRRSPPWQQLTKGMWSRYATQLNTGKTVTLDADQPVQTASVTKLAILFEALEQVRAGKAHWDEKLTLAKGDGVSGSGVLTFLTHLNPDSKRRADDDGDCQ